MKFRKLLTAILFVTTIVSTTSAQSNKKMTMTVGTGADPSFSTFFVAKVGGFFDKHGINVVVNTGPSGSAMISLVIKNQIQAALGGPQAGIQSFNLDSDVDVAAEQAIMVRYFGIVGRNIDNTAGLKGKKIGVAVGSGSEVFWRAFIEKNGLNPKDYTIVPVEAPEMLAAIERGDIDAFSIWEPWMTRTVRAVSNTKILADAGIINPRNYVFINRSWATENPETAAAFFRALVEATEFIKKNPNEAAKQVASFLKLDETLVRELMSKVDFRMNIDQTDIDDLKIIETQLKDGGKLTKPVDWKKFIFPVPLKTAAPNNVDFTLPK